MTINGPDRVTKTGKIVLIALPCSLLLLAGVVYGCYLFVSSSWDRLESQAGDPKQAASITDSMISISDPPPAQFTYRGGVDMLFTKVVILAREEHFIILVQARETGAHNTLKQTMDSGTHYGEIAGKSFRSESEGEMPVADGSFEYALGKFVDGGGENFGGMLGLLKNGRGQPRVLIESFDRSNGGFDFAATKQFLQGIKTVK